MYVLIIFLSWPNGMASVDQIDGFSTFETCQHVAHQITTGAAKVIQPKVSAECIEVQ